jgi:hypothetical protein
MTPAEVAALQPKGFGAAADAAVVGEIAGEVVAADVVVACAGAATLRARSAAVETATRPGMRTPSRGDRDDGMHSPVRLRASARG